MKKYATFFSLAGFTIQYLIPIFLFGNIIPYTRDGVGRCLTGMGYIAIAIALFFASKKAKAWLLQRPKSIKRALVLSVSPIVWWMVILLGVDFLSTFLYSFSVYWDKVILFILLGRTCYVISEALLVEEEGVKK